MAGKASFDDLYSESSTPASSRAEGRSTATEPVRQEASAERTPLEAKTDTPEPEAKAPPEKAASTGEPDKGKKDASPASEDDEAEIPTDGHVPVSALKAERAKRQDWKSKAVKSETELATERRQLEAERKEREAERRELEEYRAYMRAVQAQNQAALAAEHQRQQQQQASAAPPQPPDPYTDPAGALQYERQMMTAALQQRDAQYAQALQQQQHAMFERSVEASQRLMRSQYKDYDEAEIAFAEVARVNPQLREQLVRHPFPAEYAYQVGKEALLRRQIQEAGSLNAYAERIANQRLAEMQAQAAQTARAPIAPVQTRSQPAAPPPQSLAGVPSVAPRSRAPTGQTSLDELYRT